VIEYHCLKQILRKEYFMKRIFTFCFCLSLLLSGLVEAADEKFRVWPFYGLTGTGKTLDAIETEGEGTVAQDNDMAIGVDTSNYLYFYRYDSSSEAVETEPTVIVPNDDTDLTGRWLFIDRIYSNSIYSNTDDGGHYINLSNSGAHTFTDEDGALSSRRDRDMTFYNDGTSTVIPLQTCRQVTISSLPATLDTKYCYGTTVYVTVAGTLTIPATEPGMKFRLYSTGANTVVADPNVADTIYLYGDSLDAGDCIDSPGNVGDFVDFEYRSTNQWTIFEGEGTWTDGGAS